MDPWTTKKVFEAGMTWPPRDNAPALMGSRRYDDKEADYYYFFKIVVIVVCQQEQFGIASFCE